MVSDGHQLFPGTWRRTVEQVRKAPATAVTSLSRPQCLICEMETGNCCGEQPLPAPSPGLKARPSHAAISLARAASVADGIQQSLTRGGWARCASQENTHVSAALRRHLRKPFSGSPALTALTARLFTGHRPGRFLPRGPGTWLPQQLSHWPLCDGAERAPRSPAPSSQGQAGVHLRQVSGEESGHFQGRGPEPAGREA